ncbi:hypothetical protein [Bradyrhizobium sp. CB2312]|uniref:hypothetical protein n=1 Tax=Bradyrhizobium sp. CB2312 TaxID=3039155 RepID=UPI0024B0F060|nr:hypothetical protein [Bradyrhizobium sp. CB2312]WFU74160.1 hypothetical protein QA642_08970 [Bradyrhizobium sp. CB2312]
MSGSNPLASKPEDILTSLLERFHSDKVSAMMRVYDPNPILITSDGQTTTTEITARLE